MDLRSERKFCYGLTVLALLFFYPATAQSNSFTNGEDPVFTLTSATSGDPATSFLSPRSIHQVGPKFFIADGYNNRVLIYNSTPTSSGASAAVVVGQPDMSHSDYLPCDPYHIGHPQGVFSDGTRLFVADTGNSRVLIYNRIPTSDNAPADVVIGEPNMTAECQSAGFEQTRPSATTLNAPRAVASCGTRLFIADGDYNRVLIYNQIPTSNNASADVVIGQPDMNSSSCSAPTSARSLCQPQSVYCDGTRLFIADYYGNRVLIYNHIPTTSNAPADVVVGQPDMNNNGDSWNTLGPARSLRTPRGVFSDGTRLFIADRGHQRLLIYNSIPTSNGAAADVVIGQPNMSSQHNSGSADGAVVVGPALFVVDERNNEVRSYLPTPVNFKSTALGISSVTLSWDTVDGVDGYNTSCDVAFSTSTSCVKTGLRPADTINGTVSAKFGSLTSSTITASAYTLPAPPTGVSAPVVFLSSIPVQWTDVTNVHPCFYRVDYWKDEGLMTSVTLEAKASTLRTILTELNQNTQYNIQVLTLSCEGKSSAPSPKQRFGTLPGPPFTPTGFRASVLGISSITWSWNAVDSGYQATGYNFYPSTGGPPISLTATQLTFTGLSANTRYAGQVAAFNSGGESSPTLEAAAYTLADIPASLAASQVNASSATVSWSAVSNPNGTSYRLDYWPVAGGTASVTGTSLNSTLTNLAAATTYYVQASARNGDGLFSAPSGAIQIRTPPDSGVLTGVGAGISSITWTWSAVSGATGYRFYRASDGSAVSLAANTFTQTSLSTNVQYQGWMTAVNAGGEGQPSAAASAYALADVPTGLAASQVTDKSMTVSWGAATNPSGTTYRLDYWKTGASSASVIGTATSASLARLDSGTVYFLQVTAVNHDGIASATDGPIQAQTAPSAPANLAGAAQGVSSITWTWSAAAGASSYNFYPASGAPVVGVVSPFTQTRLSANVQYSGQLTAVNAGGESARGASASAYTLAAVPTGLAVEQVHDTWLEANWSDGVNPGGTRYRLDYWAAGGSTTGVVATATNATVDNLDVGTVYFLQVSAVNGDNVVSSPNGPVSTTTTLSSAMPSASYVMSSLIPANFFGAALGVSSIAWTWSAVPGAAGYNFYPSTGGPPIPLGVTTFDQVGLSTNTQYAGRVTAVDANGVESRPSNSTSTYTLAAAPADLAVASISSNSMTVSWSTNTNPSGTNYRADYWAAGGSTTSVTTTTASAALTELSSSTAYFVQVSAKNGDGYFSSPAGPISAQTQAASPSAPVNFAGAAQGVSSITWSWGAAAGAASYNFYFSTGGFVSLPTNTWTQTGLSTNTQYGSSVTAVNAGGESSPSASTWTYTLAAPASGLATTHVASDWLSVSWSTNTNPDGTAYRLDYWAAGVSTQSPVSTARSSVLGSLAVGTTYYLRVSAKNGDGLFAAPNGPITAQTLPPQPSIPGHLAGAAQGVSSIAWSWDAVSGATYNFYFSTGGFVSLASNSWTQTGLSTNTQYGSSVTAVNVNGESLPSVSTAVYTLAATPAGLAPAQVNFSSMTVSWSSVTNPGGTAYRLDYWPVASGTASVTGVALSAALTGLDGGATYYMQVRAQNGDGLLSSPNGPVSTATLVAAPTGLAVPARLAGTALGVSSISWSWTAVSGATGYNFYPSTGGPAITLATTTLAQVGLSTNTQYAGFVTATNAGTESLASASTSTYTLADAPAGLATTHVASTWLSLAWSPGTNPSETAYRLDYWKAGGSTTSATGTATNAALTGLDRGATYYLQVSAKNGNGLLSSPDGPISALTLSTSPANLDAPSNFVGAALGVSSISWSWTTVSGATGYNFYPSTGGPAIVLATTTLAQVGLSTNTQYAGFVTATDGGAEGPPGAAAARYTLAAPAAGLALTDVSVDWLRTAWSANTNPSGTAYRLDYWNAVGSTASVTGTALSATLTGLSGGATYYLQATALNGDGLAASPAGPISALTSAASLTAPVHLVGRALGVSSITWSWDAVSGAAGYNFYPSTGGPAIALSAAALTQVGLSTNTRYSGFVTATNAGAESLPGASAAAYTLAAPPAGLATTHVASTWLSVSWSSVTNPPGTGYRLDYWTAGGSTTSVTGTATSATLAGLAAGTTYYLQASAKNGDGLLSSPNGPIAAATLTSSSGTLAAPSSFAGAALGISSISWSWTAIAGAAGYNFYPSTGGPAIALATTTLAQVGLSTNTQYSGFVTATDGGGEGAPSGLASVYTMAAAPAGLAAPQINADWMIASWSANTNPAGTVYRLDYWTAGGSTTSVAGTATNAALIGLAVGTTYYLQASAANGDGLLSSPDGPVSALTLAAPLATPSRCAASVVGTSSITWSWNAVSGASSYNFYSSTASSPIALGGPLLAQVGLSTNTQHACFVAAVNAGRQGPVGAPVALYTLAAPPVGLSATNIGINAFTVPWSANTNPSGTVYRLDYWTAGGSTASVTGTATQAVLTGLAAGTSYYFSVLASNGDDVLSAAAGPLSALTLLSSTITDMDSVKIFPNPFRPALGHGSMTFNNLPAGATIKIYTLLGEKVAQIQANGSGTASWDVKNSAGVAAASGVYFVRVTADQGSGRTLKLAVQR